MALVCNVAWAQTVVGALGNPTTTLTDGNYVLVAKSSKNNGNAGPVFFNTTASGRKYQYDTNSPLGVGDAVLSKYVWTIDETTDENGVQHITITNYDDNTKFFPADAGKNQNFAGNTIASLKPEVKTIGGVDYIVLTLDDSTIGYIHANQDGNNPNLSYWDSYGEDGTCVKFTFHPVVELSELSRSFYTSQAPNDMTWRDNTTWYFIQFPNSDGYHTGGYLAAEGSGFISSNNYSNNVSNGKLLITQTEKPIKKSALWCIVGDETNGYKFYNKMNPKLVLGTASDGTAHLYLASETKNGVSYAYDYAPSGSGTHSGCATFRVKGSTKYWNNFDGGGNPDYLSVWDHTNALSDNGSAIRLTQVTEHELAEMAAKLPVASTATEKKYYAIKNQRSADYATYVGDAAQIKHQARDTESAAQMWYFTADGNGYRMHNLATTNKYKNTSSFTADGAKVWVKENPYCAGFVCISTQENLGGYCWDSGNNNLIGTWNPRATDYEGTSWMLEEVSPTATLPLAKLDAKLHVDDNANILGELIGQAYYIVGEAKVYDAAAVKTAIEAAESIEAVTAIKESFTVNNGVNITSKNQLVSGGVYTFVTSRGWVGANDGDNAIGTVKTSVTPAASHNNPMFQWALYQSNNGNYYLYNLGKQKFLGVPSENNGPIPFVDTPTGKNLTFKDNGHADYPIMFSTNNRHAVSQNSNAGLFAWEGGWTNMNDAGSNHKVTLVSELPEATLQEIAAKVEAYDKRLYVTAEVEGSWENNPNTHFGSVRATASTGTLTSKLKTTPSVATVDYDGLNETIIDFTRDYRGFEFQGYSFGGVDLGKSFTLTDEQKASITAENPLIAKFTATEAVTLFYDDDEFSYRIPAIAKTSTGRLIAVSDYRHCLDDIGMNRWGKGYRIDLVVRTSDDNGKTWSPKKIIAEGIDNSQANDCAYGDAAIAVVGEEIIVMAVAGSTQYGTGNANKISRLARIYSADNGENWVKEDITEKVYGHEGSLYPNVYTAFFGSGRLAVDPNFNESGNARIYGSLLTQGNGNVVLYSDDKGLNWHKLGGQVANANEPKIEILPNGQLLFSARRNGGRNFNVFTYTDKANGEGTWSNAVDGCGNEGQNGTNGETFLIDAKNARGEDVKLLLQSQPVGGGAWDRANVSIWYKEISSDASHNHTPSEIAGGWTKGMQVSHQLSAYSAMSLQEDGRIAFFFEEAPCYADNYNYGYCMVYMPLTIEEITKNKYFSLDFDFDTEREFSVVLTDAQGNEYRDQVTSSFGSIATALTTKYPFITMGDTPNLESDGENFTYTNTVTLPFKVSNEETTVWHNIYYPINTNEYNYPAYMSAAEGSDVVKIVTESAVYGNSTQNTLENASKISWAVYQSETDDFSFILKNKFKDQFLKTTSAAPTGSGNENVRYTSSIDEAAAFVPSTEGHNSNYQGKHSLKIGNGCICVWSVSNGYVTYSQNKSHKGAWVKFTEAPDFEALIDEVNATLDMIGTSLGQYTVSDANVVTAAAAKEAMQNSGRVKLNDLNNYKTLLVGATLNIPVAGQYFRIRGISGNYIDATSLYDTTTRQMSMKSAEECNYNGTIFYLDEDKHLVNYATGTYVKETREIGNVGDAAGVWSFAESPRTGKGKYALTCTTTNNNGRHLHDNSGNRVDRCSSNCGDRHDFILEEVTALPVSITSATGFGTLYTPVALTLPEGVNAYTGLLSEVDGEYVLTLSAVEDGIIPARTGVILQGEADDYAFEVTSSTAAAVGDLKGSVATIVYNSAEKSPYTLQTSATSSTGVAFKKYSGANITAGKVYLELPTIQTAAAVRVRFADTTGIETLKNDAQGSALIYDLLGRPVEKMEKGIYIVNGKKVVIK